MRKFFSLSFFVALFAILVTNNIAKAQPASFTQDFLQEDYRNGQVVRTNTVTVVWDASTQQLTFNNFYRNTDIVNSPSAVVNLPINYGASVTSLTWESDTKASFTWRVAYLGKTTKFSWTGYQHALVSHMIYYQQGVTTIYNERIYYTYSGGTDCHGTIDLEKGEITLDNPWGCVIAQGTYWYTPSSSRVVEYFERSKMTIIKTDLVDIVNDGEVGEEYTVNDDLVGVKVVDNVPAEGIEFADNTTQNTFKIAPGKYKLEVELDDNKKPISLRVSQASPTAELTPWNVEFGAGVTRVHIFGQVNDYNINYWDPTQGQRMETTDGVHYSALVNFYDRGDGYSYFSITTDLAQNNDQGGWDYVNGNRYGPSSNNFPISLGKVLFAKDLGKFKNPSVLLDGQDDFMGRVEAKDMYEKKVHPAAEYDQSNWVMLTGLNNPSQFVGNLIKGKSIKGTLVDKVNPTLAVSSNPEQGDQYGYEPNLYIMPSFNEAYYSPNSQFFFVAPKVQEYAYITWACYNATDGNFYTMSDGNLNNLTGGIKVNWDYYPAGNPQDGYVYEFDAIVRKVASTTSGAPLLKDGNQSTPVTDDLSAEFMVYPLKLYDVPTAINTVETSSKIVDVKYYNMLGIESATPFNGVNVVVTTYDNGNRTTNKKLYK